MSDSTLASHPSTSTREASAFVYQSGFGNSNETEALPGALPRGQNSPQRCPYGLYAEQLSGTAFTAPRDQNLRSWLYRIRPSVKHSGLFHPVDAALWVSAPHTHVANLPIGPLRWGATPLPSAEERALNFITGLRTITTAGDVFTQTGMASHVYLANTSMIGEHLMNADGELLILPELGALRLRTELGCLEVQSGEIAVIPRGVVFRVELIEGPSRGYVLENYSAPLRLPDLGPIGSNCLANPRDFLTPVAWYEDRDEPCEIYARWGGKLYRTEIDHSPLDVVAWHGNYAPYKYDLNRFCTIGSILFDHPDPSIFTVLTSPSAHPGTANVDFVIFPERWLVAEDTFRPPWYHRNVMSEFMGLLYGQYDAKEEGFVPGGMSLHNMMLPHGPDSFGFEKASLASLAPQKLSGTMAFMFETRYPQHLTTYSESLETRHVGYADCWSGLKKRFNGTLEGDWSAP